MIRACPALLILLFLLPANSPRAMGQDVDHLYLKSGSVIRGTILNFEPDDHVEIEDLCGNLWYYPVSDIRKITSEPFEKRRRTGAGPLGFEKGFANITSIGFLAGSSGSTQVAPFSLLMSNGWRSPAGIYTGAGLGIEFLASNYMPLYADVRYDLPGSEVVPYVGVKGGFTIPLTGEDSEYDVDYSYSGGPLAGVGAGLKIKTRDHFAWDVSVLYRYQKTSYRETYGWNDHSYDYTDIYHRIEIRLGFYID